MGTTPGTINGVAYASIGAAIQSILQVPAATIAAFDQAYETSWPPPQQTLLQMEGYPQKLALAQQLMQEGYTIDYEIMVAGGDPYVVMYQRVGLGYPTYPSMDQNPPTESPTVPGFVADPNWKLLVSINPASFPPFEVQPPPAPTPTNVVGSLYTGSTTMYMAGPGYTAWKGEVNAVSGSTVIQGGITYKLVLYNLMGSLQGCYFVTA